MRALILEVPQALLEERRRLGHDRHDEMWEGVLHMVPQRLSWHQRFGTLLVALLDPLASARGMQAFYEVGFYRRDDDYRVPDQAYARPEQVTVRGVEGPVPVVIELLSPGDESYEKIPWYLGQGVGEVLIIDPHSRRVERHTAAGVERDRIRVAALGVEMTTVESGEGPRLRITWEGGSAEI